MQADEADMQKNGQTDRDMQEKEAGRKMWKLRGKEKPDTLKEDKEVDTPAEKARQMKAAILSKESKPSEDPEPAPEDIPKPLPPGWQVAMDPKSGKQYFYNKKLKISQWDRPCEQDPEIEPPPATPSKSALRWLSWDKVVEA
eukprot:755095-Hanusia_phi.AAC.7